MEPLPDAGLLPVAQAPPTTNLIKPEGVAYHPRQHERPTGAGHGGQLFGQEPGLGYLPRHDDWPVPLGLPGPRGRTDRVWLVRVGRIPLGEERRQGQPEQSGADYFTLPCLRMP